MKSMAMIASALVIAGGASAQGVNTALCLARKPGESIMDYTLRGRHDCEVKWNEMVASNQTGTWTHRRWLDHCRRDCGYDTATTANAAPIAGALLAAGGVIGAAVALKSGGGGEQTSVSP